MTAPRTHVRLGTRASKLALWQAEHVAAGLRLAWGERVRVEIVKVSTQGDRDKTSPLHTLGGKGVFVREIERLLLAGEIDLAVHSMKDLPSRLPEGLVLDACPPRADVRDALVLREGLAGEVTTLAELPEGARVGTGSLRRAALLRRHAPQVRPEPIRGNVPTRLSRLEGDGLDAVLLAAAGLDRLGLGGRAQVRLDPDVFCPAACQGLLGLEIREDDAGLRAALAPLDDEAARLAARAERGFLARLGADCNVPLGCHARLDADGRLTLRAVVVGEDGEPYFEARQAGPSDQAEAVGRHAAEELIAAGAEAVLGRV